MDKQADGSFLVTTEDGKTATASQVMYATGRKANTDNLGLETAGVAVNPNGGAIIVDDSSKTNVRSIWAVGDVTNRINLTPVALHEGHCFADTEFGRKPRTPCHDLVAAAVFSQPPIGTVGLTQEQAGKRYKKVAIYRSGFRPMVHTMTGANTRALMKIVVDMETDKVVGMHMCGPEAAEIMQAQSLPLSRQLYGIENARS